MALIQEDPQPSFSPSSIAIVAALCPHFSSLSFPTHLLLIAHAWGAQLHHWPHSVERLPPALTRSLQPCFPFHVTLSCSMSQKQKERACTSSLALHPPLPYSFSLFQFVQSNNAAHPHLFPPADALAPFPFLESLAPAPPGAAAAAAAVERTLGGKLSS